MKHGLASFFVVIGLALVGAGMVRATPSATMTGRIAIQLQQAGLDPVQARWGAWAVLHNPRNDCAIYAGRISAQADMPGWVGHDSDHGTESDVMYVEQHNLCTERSAKKGLGVEQRARHARDKRDAPDRPMQRRLEGNGGLTE